MKRTFLHAFALVVLAALSVHAAPEAFEVGPANKEQLPGGKEADGIIGDFVLRNDKVEAVISHNALYRRANMSTFYGDNGITPGCLYDLTLRGANNDQITIFSPSGQQGIVSYVRVFKDGRDGEAAIETVMTAANNNGLFKRHEYRLRDGWQGVWITTTLRNEGKETRQGTVDDRWTTFLPAGMGTAGDVDWADAVDPADKAGYAHGWLEKDGLKAPPDEVSLKPGQEISYARFLAVGHSPAEAIGVLQAMRGPTGTVRASILDGDGKAISTAKAEFIIAGKPVNAYPDANGKFELSLPAGSYDVEVSDIGRTPVKHPVTVTAGMLTTINTKLDAPSAIVFDVRDDSGKSIPCKAQFNGVGDTKSPVLGPNNRAHGCVDQYHSETGQFRVQVPPGQYDVVVTHGIEFTHRTERVNLAPGKTHTFKATLKRVVDTTGWISADFHNHSTPSGDNTCGTDDRLINLVAEQVEFAPTTEHNRLFDWRPYIEKLGLTSELNTVSGMELTGSAAHFNSFPFTPEPFTQDNGAPRWNPDPRITAITLRNHQKPDADRWIQINHPDMVANFIDADGDGRVDGGFLGLPQLIDGIETQNGSVDILAGAPFRVGKDAKTGKDTVQMIREFIWLQLLNRGHRYVGMAVCDAHQVYGNGVGGWRMYFPSHTDKPPEIDWREISKHAKAGHSILTTGPFLQVMTDDGTPPGGTTRASGSIKLKVKVQCTDWVDIDRVQVLVNGRQRKDVNFTRAANPQMFKDGVVKFDETITVPLSQDSHLIVVATGENFDLKTGYGSSTQGKFKPLAYNNPIFVDADGGGFTPNGDSLGWDLPAKGLTVETARAMLEEFAASKTKDVVPTKTPASKAKAAKK